tara:strand:- start:47 stop:319 length:273 start_codon:yes stop_codon:yes gene_type:complete
MGILSDETLLIFPCQYPIKIMGRAGKNFRSVAMELLEANVGEISEEAIATSLSNKGNFLSLTVTIRADSKQQLDNLYRDLSTHDEVLFVL